MPKFVKRALLLLVVFAMLTASLYGCTGGTEPTPTAGVSDSGSDPAAAQSGELPDGNSVTVGIAQDLNNLDPQLAATAGIREVLFNIFEGLVKASPDGSVIPAVASDYEISEDGTTYTFTLRASRSTTGNRSQPRMWSIPWNAAPDRRTMERLWSRRFPMSPPSRPPMTAMWSSPWPRPARNSSTP